MTKRFMLPLAKEIKLEGKKTTAWATGAPQEGIGEWIKEVYRGDKYQDTCISEIEFEIKKQFVKGFIVSQSDGIDNVLIKLYFYIKIMECLKK
ncbi:MAG: hypothetical protein ACMUJM_13795 [bacterium]